MCLQLRSHAGAEKPAQAVKGTGTEAGCVVSVDDDASAKRAALAEARARVANEAKAWMAANIGESFELQPKSRSKGKEHVGDHITSEVPRDC